MKKQTPELQAFYFHPPFEQNYWPDILLETYKQRVYQRFMPPNPQGKICVEIGANVGLVAYYFAQYFEKVYAIEPAKTHIECLEAMTRQNYADNIQICKYAIAGETGKTKFYHNPNQTMYSLKDGVNDKTDYEEVETLTFSDFMELEKLESIDFLKLDCEGTEGEIVVSDGFTSVADKIKVIVGEWHSWGSMSQQAFANCLKDQGFKFTWLPTEAQVFTAERV